MTTREDKKNIRSAVIMVVLAILSILFLFFVGIPLIGKFTAYLGDLRKFNKNNVSDDVTPPAPPKFNSFSDFTNKKTFDITGTAEAGATIKLDFDGSEKQNLTDKNGNFTFNVELKADENSFSAIAVDPAGNTSQPTKTYSISFDDKPPELTITKPDDGASFFGITQRQLTIQGKTDPDTQVTINDRFVNVDSEGTFQFTLTMPDGQNTFNIKATDQAGNVTEKSLNVSFSP